jgi:hypothetical protein
VTSEKLTYKDGVAHIRFAPLRVAHGAVELQRRHANGGKTIALRRVELRQD